MEGLYSQILLISEINLWGTISRCVWTAHVLTASESSICDRVFFPTEFWSPRGHSVSNVYLFREEICESASVLRRWSVRGSYHSKRQKKSWKTTSADFHITEPKQIVRSIVQISGDSLLPHVLAANHSDNRTIFKCKAARLKSVRRALCGLSGVTEKSIVEIDVLDLLNVRFTLRGAKIKLGLAAVYFVEEHKKGTIWRLISQDLAKRINEYLCAAWNGDWPCSSDLTA